MSTPITTKLDSRQVISRDALDQIALSSGKEVDDLLRSLNSEVTPPLRISAITLLSSSASVSNGSSTVTVTSTAHGLTTGDFIKVTTASALGGISAANLSVTTTVTVLTVDSFTYTAAASATANATGTIDTVNTFVVRIGSINVSNPETSKNNTLTPINNVIPAFTSGTITIPITNNNNMVVSPGTNQLLNITSGQYVRIGLSMDASGNITLSQGTPSATLSSASTPAPIAGLLSVGYFVLQNSSGSITPVTNGNIYQFTNPTVASAVDTGLLDLLKDEFIDSPYQLLTPNVISTDSTTKFSSFSGSGFATAAQAYSAATNTIKYTGASQAATSVQMLDTVEFLNYGLDVGSVDLTAQWNRSSSLNTPDAATTYTNLGISVTNGSATVKVTTPTEHHLTSTSKITTFSSAVGGISGANLSVTNAPITIIDKYTFSYTASASATSTTTGILATLNVLGFLYEVSRDGGTNYFTVPMTRAGLTEAFRGNLRFDTASTTESVIQDLGHQLTASSGFTLTTTASVGQKFTLTSTSKVQKFQLYFARGTGTPVGNLYVTIVKDSGGLPSTSSSDVLAQSNAISISGLGLTTSQAQYAIDVPDVVLLGSTSYHVTITTDATYQAGYTSSSNNSVIVGYINASTGLETATSGVWSSAGANSMAYIIQGRALDLRVRISSPAAGATYPCGLDGYGIFYNLQDVGIVGSNKKTQRFVFNSTTDNSNTFNISAFSPDPDLLTCYHVEGGSAFKVPAFSLDGSVATFPTNTFNNAGVSTTVTLIFEQNNGGAYDNSDSNAQLLAANHLGSSSGTIDKSAAGRGILLRRPDGTLREISINNSDNIVISTVP